MSSIKLKKEQLREERNYLYTFWFEYHTGESYIRRDPEIKKIIRQVEYKLIQIHKELDRLKNISPNKR